MNIKEKKENIIKLIHKIKGWWRKYFIYEKFLKNDSLKRRFFKSQEIDKIFFMSFKDELIKVSLKIGKQGNL